MPSVNLEDNEWQFLINVLGNKLTWVEANPLLMKIGQQLREKPEHGPDGRFRSGNSKEVPAAEAQLESKSPH